MSKKTDDATSGITVDHVRNFYSIDVFITEIADYSEKEFKKELSAFDIVKVALFTLHNIVLSDSDDEKEYIKIMLSGMIDDKLNLNEWLYSRAKEIEAYDYTIAECYKNKDFDNLDEKIEIAIEKAKYKAWNDELAVNKTVGNNLIKTAINDGD